MTFVELQRLTSDWVDDPDNDYFTLPILKMRLNLALKELQKRLISANEEWYSVCVKANTVVGQSKYSFPTDFLQVLRLEYITNGTGVNANYRKIEPITPNQRDLIIDTQGDAWAYWLSQNNFILKPIPNRIVEIHLEYAYMVADMVNDNDVPDAPAMFHEYIPILCARDCFIKDGRSIANFQEKMVQYEMLLKQIAQERQADAPRMTVVTTWDGF